MRHRFALHSAPGLAHLIALLLISSQFVRGTPLPPLPRGCGNQWRAPAGCAARPGSRTPRPSARCRSRRAVALNPGRRACPAVYGVLNLRVYENARVQLKPASGLICLRRVRLALAALTTVILILQPAPALECRKGVPRAVVRPPDVYPQACSTFAASSPQTEPSSGQQTPR